MEKLIELTPSIAAIILIVFAFLKAQEKRDETFLKAQLDRDSLFIANLTQLTEVITNLSSNVGGMEKTLSIHDASMRVVADNLLHVTNKKKTK